MRSRRARAASVAPARSNPSQPSVPKLAPLSRTPRAMPSRAGGSPSRPVTVTNAARSPRSSASRTAALGSMRPEDRKRPCLLGRAPLKVPDRTLLAVATDAERAGIDVLREVEEEGDDHHPHQRVDLARLAADELQEPEGH